MIFYTCVTTHRQEPDCIGTGVQFDISSTGSQIHLPQAWLV
jgi:hypothetical protein